MRTLPEALAAAQDVIVRAGHYRLVASPVHVVGFHPDYRPPPRLGEHGAPD
jgi:CoA:oxalate CoA-transferase